MSAGHTLNESTKCGLSCIKFSVHGEDNVENRTYNKVLETIQVGKPKRDNISCKLAKLLTPSTLGLTNKFHDPAFYENGITRNEVTFTFSEGKAWSLKAMDLVHGKCATLLKNCLVCASVQHHLSGMERCLKRSVVVFSPPTFKWKMHQQILAKGKDKSIEKQYPDGVVMRWKNKYSDKTNGVEAHGKITGLVKDRDTSGWASVARLAAACCHSSQDPRLFIIVAGTQRFFTKEENGPAHVYLREVPLQRFAIAPSESLQITFIGSTHNTMGSLAEWSQIGVQPHGLTMNLRILPHARLSDILTELAIPVDFSPADLHDVDDASSTAIPAFGGKRPREPDGFNMPDIPFQWDLLASQNVGKFRTPKLYFWFRGARFWVPKLHQDEVRAKVFEQHDVTCWCQWRNGRFHSTILQDNETSALLQAGATSPMQIAVQPATILGPKKGMWDIPVSTQGHEILHAGVRFLKGPYGTVFVDIQAGLFNLPKSFSVFLLTMAEARLTPKDLTFLQGCWLIRPNTSRVDVTAHGNQEPHMWIASATGEILAEQAFTQTKASMKKREHDALSGGEPVAKLQRVA